MSFMNCTITVMLTVVQLWFWCHIYVCLNLFMSLCYLCHYALSSLTTCNFDCCIIMVTVLVLYNMHVVCMPLCLYVILIHVIRLLFFFPSLCNIQGMFNVLID